MHAAVAAQEEDDDGVGESDEDERDAGEEHDVEPRHPRREHREALDRHAHVIRVRVVAVLGLQLVRHRQVRVQRAQDDEQREQNGAGHAERAELLRAERQSDPNEAVDRHGHYDPRGVLHAENTRTQSAAVSALDSTRLDSRRPLLSALLCTAQPTRSLRFGILVITVACTVLYISAAHIIFISHLQR